jgi:3D (Asp-Asp-Asp) domain-containing protein
MSKPLWGGSAACVALLSASLLFYAQPSVAETLAVAASQEIQQKGEAQTVKTSDVEIARTTGAPVETSDANNDKETPITVNPETPKTASAAPLAESEAEIASPTLTFTATAYSLRGRTASGKFVARGLIAADRRVLPIGTRVRLEAGSYSGEYTVADTGGAVRGRKIDIWVPSTGEAMRFGRRAVKVTVLTRTRKRATTPHAHAQNN